MVVVSGHGKWGAPAQEGGADPEYSRAGKGKAPPSDHSRGGVGVPKAGCGVGGPPYTPGAGLSPPPLRHLGGGGGLAQIAGVVALRLRVRPVLQWRGVGKK